jgi:protein ImuA
LFFINGLRFGLTPPLRSGINRTKHELTEARSPAAILTAGVLEAVMAAARPAFFSSADGAAARIARLRRTLGAAERAVGLGCESSAPLTLGIPLIDRILGGGLGGGALHEVSAVRETEITAASGFVLALTARSNASAPAIGINAAAINAATGRDAIWIAEDLSLAENGAPYGPGLHEVGIAPEKLITVAAARRRDVLWAMEEALRCRALGVVIGELRGRSIDQVATRRLALAAAAGNTLGFILRTAPDDAPCAAATRWIIGAAPSFPTRHADKSRVAAPRMAAHLVRNRRGHLGAWIVEWNSVEQRFELTTDSEPVAFPAFDRPHRAAVA